VLVDAFLHLRRRRKGVRLRVAGWMGPHNRAYGRGQFDRLSALHDAFEYQGTVDRAAKLTFLSQIDVLSVPTTYREPKGLYVLEAIASGVPAVQPSHGAFPEMIGDIGGGRLVAPNDPKQLAEVLDELLGDVAELRRLGESGRQQVLRRRSADVMARATLDVYQRLLEDRTKRR
jgi:glycosyltransferase involved in cell wall biosynthesis